MWMDGEETEAGCMGWDQMVQGTEQKLQDLILSKQVNCEVQLMSVLRLSENSCIHFYLMCSPLNYTRHTVSLSFKEMGEK